MDFFQSFALLISFQLLTSHWPLFLLLITHSVASAIPYCHAFWSDTFGCSSCRPLFSAYLLSVWAPQPSVLGHLLFSANTLFPDHLISLLASHGFCKNCGRYLEVRSPTWTCFLSSYHPPYPIYQQPLTASPPEHLVCPFPSFCHLPDLSPQHPSRGLGQSPLTDLPNSPLAHTVIHSVHKTAFNLNMSAPYFKTVNDLQLLTMKLMVWGLICSASAYPHIPHHFLAAVNMF